MYANGQNLPQDDAQAVTCYRQAAEQGHSVAQFNLGASYFTGRGVPQDYVEAHKWRNLAASRTSAENQTRHTKIRDALATLMTPAQVAEAQKLAREWQTAFDAPQDSGRLTMTRRIPTVCVVLVLLVSGVALA
jgi:TPR repeat protein